MRAYMCMFYVTIYVEVLRGYKTVQNVLCSPRLFPISVKIRILIRATEMVIQNPVSSPISKKKINFWLRH